MRQGINPCAVILHKRRRRAVYLLRRQNDASPNVAFVRHVDIVLATHDSYIRFYVPQCRLQEIQHLGLDECDVQCRVLFVLTD